MAGDWIPFRHDLIDDPAVREMAEMISPKPRRKTEYAQRLHMVCGCCANTWRIFDAQTADGLLRSWRRDALDIAVGVDGWADAMIKVGWLVETAEGLRMPDFDVWLSRSAKRRMMEAKRKTAGRHADAHADGDADAVRPTGQDSIGGDPPKPPAGGFLVEPVKESAGACEAHHLEYLVVQWGNPISGGDPGRVADRLADGFPIDAIGRAARFARANGASDFRQIVRSADGLRTWLERADAADSPKAKAKALQARRSSERFRLFQAGTIKSGSSHAEIEAAVDLAMAEAEGPT
jgi:hypothetical protein